MKQFFLAPQIGSGTLSDPFRNVLGDHMQSGETFDEVDHPFRRMSLCLVTASAATLDAIAALPNVYRASPRIDDAALATLLVRPLSSWPAQVLQDARTFLENNGIPLDGIAPADPFRKVIRRILRVCFIAQKAEAADSSALRVVLTAALNGTVGQLPAATRQTASAWLATKGVNTSGWTLATTIRTVLRAAAEEITWKPARFGGHSA